MCVHPSPSDHAVVPLCFAGGVKELMMTTRFWWRSKVPSVQQSSMALALRKTRDFFKTNKH